MKASDRSSFLALPSCAVRGALLALLFCVGLPRAPAAEPGVGDVAVEFRDERYIGHVNFRVAVPPAVALVVLTDFDHMADFMPNLSSSRVLARVGDVYRVEQAGKVDLGPFSFHFSSERRIEVFPEGRIVARALSGSTRYMHSDLNLQPSGDGGVRIDYQIEMLPETWMPSGIGVAFMRHQLAEQFNALGREMLRRNQAVATH